MNDHQRVAILTAVGTFIGSSIAIIFCWVAIWRASRFFEEWTLNPAAGDCLFWMMGFVFNLVWLISYTKK